LLKSFVKSAPEKPKKRHFNACTMLLKSILTQLIQQLPNYRPHYKHMN